MPAIRTTRTERMQRAFEAAYRVGKARTGMTEQEIARALGFKSVISLRRRRNDMSKLSVVDAAKLVLILQLTEEEIESFVSAAIR